MKYNNKSFIGIFDSGFGGISVLNRLNQLMPYENYVYYADSGHFPYGKKSKAELVSIGKDILSKFQRKNAKAVVIACNTMSTSDMPSFYAAFPELKIIGTFPDFTQFFKSGQVLSSNDISFSKEDGLQVKRERKKLLIISTTATCKSKYLTELINEAKNLLSIYNEPADFIAKAVENNELDSFDFKAQLSDLLKTYHDTDYLLLGCTHFPFAVSKMREILGNNVEISSSGNMAADKCYNYLSENKLTANNLNPYIKLVDENIDKDKIEIYNKLINLKNKSQKIEYVKSI